MSVKGVQFVTDVQGKKTGVLIDLSRHRHLWEDIYDIIVAETRKDEPRISWEEVKGRLKERRSRHG